MYKTDRYHLLTPLLGSASAAPDDTKIYVGEQRRQIFVSGHEWYVGDLQDNERRM